MISHVDDSVVLVLVNHKIASGNNGDMINAKKEWHTKQFSALFGHYMAVTKLFPVTQDEVYYALKATDEWIMDTYKNDEDVMEKYTKHSTMPHDIDKRYPKTYRHYWDILTMVNQNKQCQYKVLKRPIPQFPELRVSNFSGFKVTGPFSTDRKNYFNTLKLEGRPRDIDEFAVLLRT